MKNKILSVSTGVTMILLATGFFIRSFNQANAAPTPETFLQQSNNKTGKYMMIMNDDGGSVLVWDTETGKSMYYGVTGGKFNTESRYQIPENPLGN